MDKELKDMTFEELVNWAAGRILLDLIAGKFKDGVWVVCDAACKWREASKK